MIQIRNSPRFYYEKEQKNSYRYITQINMMMIFMTKITSSKDKNNNYLYNILFKAVKTNKNK